MSDYITYSYKKFGIRLGARFGGSGSPAPRDHGCLGFGFQGVYSLGFRVWVEGSGFRVWGLYFKSPENQIDESIHL